MQEPNRLCLPGQKACSYRNFSAFLARPSFRRSFGALALGARAGPWAPAPQVLCRTFFLDDLSSAFDPSRESLCAIHQRAWLSRQRHVTGRMAKKLPSAAINPATPVAIRITLRAATSGPVFALNMDTVWAMRTTIAEDARTRRGNHQVAHPVAVSQVSPLPVCHYLVAAVDVGSASVRWNYY